MWPTPNRMLLKVHVVEKRRPRKRLSMFIYRMAYAEEIRNWVPARIIGGTSLRGDVLH